MKQVEKKVYLRQAEKIFTVINPVSANGRTAKIWPEYREVLQKKGYQIDSVMTNYPGHATQIVREAIREGYEFIMSVGGDGTVNEVVNGFFCGQRLINPEAKLIVFSQGTGSDFIKSLGLSNGLNPLLRVLERGEVNLIDLGLITYVTNQGSKNTRYFINLTDAGIGGATVDRVNKSSKFYGGFLTYLIGALKTLIKYDNKRFRLYIDGKKKKEEIINSIMIANGNYFAGGMKIAPGADLVDGLFNIIVLGDLSKLEIVTNLYRAYKGTHLSHPKISVFQGKKIRIESDQEVLLNVDGESLGRLPAEFEMFTRKLPVLLV
mgnify:CR=1 FL=1